MIPKDRFILSVFAVLFGGAVVLSAPSSFASLDGIEIVEETPVFFSIQEGNDNDAMARKALENLLKRSEVEVGRHIPLGVSRVDLNGDGIRELFVRVLDQDLFCKEDDCQVYGFAVTESGFIKIADFKPRSIDILETKTQGTKDLLLRFSDGAKKKYVWNGKEYAELREDISKDEKE